METGEPGAQALLASRPVRPGMWVLPAWSDSGHRAGVGGVSHASCGAAPPDQGRPAGAEGFQVRKAPEPRPSAACRCPRSSFCPCPQQLAVASGASKLGKPCRGGGPLPSVMAVWRQCRGEAASQQDAAGGFQTERGTGQGVVSVSSRSLFWQFLGAGVGSALRAKETQRAGPPRRGHTCLLLPKGAPCVPVPWSQHAGGFLPANPQGPARLPALNPREVPGDLSAHSPRLRFPPKPCRQPLCTVGGPGP